MRQDLDVARLIYDERGNTIQLALEILSQDSNFQSAVLMERTGILVERLEQMAERIDLDFAGIVRPNGYLLCRIGPQSYVPGSSMMTLPEGNPIAGAALTRGAPVAGTIVLDEPTLRTENPELAMRARILPVSPPGPSPRTIPETAGLSIAAAVPVLASEQIRGAVYGGVLLNRDNDLVDTIGETVFQNEIYRNRNVGTATIFFDDLRIATSVRRQDGERAIGTFVSPEVAHRVLAEGVRWSDRALVVDEWYITAYEPILDIFDQRVGMLYVGVLEAKYADVRQAALQVFTGITLAGVVLALVVGWFLADRIVRPVNRLIRGSIEISEGNLSPKIGDISKGDIGLLQREFLRMSQALQMREQRQKEESECRLIQSEKQASIGKLAAGVAHEINNPLTAVITFTHLILQRNDLPEEVRSDLETVSLQTDRVRKIVKGLLEFSRQTRPELESVQLNDLLAGCVRLMENQALVRGIDMRFEGEADLPALTLDRNQLQSVIINMLINALDATEAGGTVLVSARPSSSDPPGVEFSVQDTGTGIAPEDMEMLFDPFFTTKEVGKGTGLGLSVSAGIVDRHGGNINVRSTVGEGSTFTIWLPVHSREKLESAGPETEEQTDACPDCR